MGSGNMKKFIFGIVVIIVVGIVVVTLPKQGKEDDKQLADAGVDSLLRHYQTRTSISRQIRYCLIIQLSTT